MALECKFNDLPDNTYLVEFNQSSDHIVMLSSTESIPEDTSGFYLSRIGMGDRWNYSDYTTVYRKLSNTQIQFSNDGSQYVPPVRDVIVQAIFNDGDNVYGFRPDEVDVQMYKNGKKTAIAALKASKNYKATYKDRPVEDVFTIEPPDLERYSKTVNGTTVTYTVFIPQPRTVSDNDMAQALMDMYEEKNPESLANIYASYCENNTKNFFDVPNDMQDMVSDIISADGFMVNEDGTISLRPINIEEA